MSDKKAIKRSVRAVWDRVKLLRSDCSKLYAPGDIEASAKVLASAALELQALSKQLSALRAMPPVEPQTPPTARKAKNKS